MKKLNVLAILFSIGLLASCSSTEIEDEIGLENELEIKSNDYCVPCVPGLPPVPPPPLPCYTCF